MKTKKCIECGKILGINRFAINKTHKDGHANICKHCVNLRWKERKLNKYTKPVVKSPVNQKVEKNIIEYQKTISIKANSLLLELKKIKDINFIAKSLHLPACVIDSWFRGIYEINSLLFEKIEKFINDYNKKG